MNGPPLASRRGARGFTLLEVLVALVVIALALLALGRAASVQVADFDALRERTLAGWVAANVVTDTRLAQIPPTTGRSDGHVELAGRRWRWQREIQPTPAPRIARIDVQVFVEGADAPSASLRGFRSEVEP